MDQINALMRDQLTERELIIFLLVTSGMSTHKLASLLLTNSMNIHRTFVSARSKIDRLAEAGLLSTPIEESIKTKSKKH